MEQDYSSLKVPCAALAFHKALIGIAQLDALEKMSMTNGHSTAYGARAVYTYYVVYHVFCTCMLLAPEQYTGKLKKPLKYGEVKDCEIDSSLETPEQWNNGKKFESDWATLITHEQIKTFCTTIRGLDDRTRESIGPYFTALYKYFIEDKNSENKCIPGLYEKLCYVRDRVIYRPSYVETQSGRIVQTSAQLGEEICSLPSAKDLYYAVSEIYQGFVFCMQDERKNGNSDIYILLLSEIWAGSVIENLENLCRLGHKKRRLQYLGVREEGGMYRFPTYIAHLLELESIDYIRVYTKKYWKPLEIMCRNAWKQRV